MRETQAGARGRLKLGQEGDSSWGKRETQVGARGRLGCGKKETQAGARGRLKLGQEGDSSWGKRETGLGQEGDWLGQEGAVPAKQQSIYGIFQHIWTMV
jgi:hypothetical protein